MSKKEKNTDLSRVSASSPSLAAQTGVSSAQVTRKNVVKKIKYGGTATVLTAVFIALVVAVNIFLSYAESRFTMKWDMTEEKTFSLDTETLTLLSELDGREDVSGVEIIVLGDEAKYRSSSSEVSSVSLYKYVTETLDNYTKNGAKISIRFIDPRYNPRFFTERGISLDDGTDTASSIFMVIYSPDTGRYRTVKTTVFDDMNYVGLERRMTSGLMYVTARDIQKVAFASGHGEKETAYFYELLKDNGFDVYYYDFSDKTSEKIPDDISLLVICNPSRGYSTDDIEKIDSWLSAEWKLGHHLMLFSDLDAYNDRHLNSYLAEWGMSLGGDNIFDTTSSGNVYTLSGAYAPLLRVGYGTGAADIVGKNSDLGSYLNLRLGKVRSVKKLYDSKDDTTLYSVLTTSGTSFGHYTADSDAVSLSNFRDYCVRKTEDTEGPFDVAVVALRTRYEGMTQFASSVTVTGSMAAVEDYFISNIDGANQQTAAYMLRLVRAVTSTTKATDSMILPDTLIFNTLSFENDAQVIAVMISLVAGIPLLLSVVGIVIAGRRRKL